MSYLLVSDKDSNSLNVSGIRYLSKTETTTRGIKKVQSYAFCHKTFQEFSLHCGLP